MEIIPATAEERVRTVRARFREYARLGFRTVAPYYHNPLPGVSYWELSLKKENA
jgi:nicotinamide mononucleotide adenylyltransferase